MPPNANYGSDLPDPPPNQAHAHDSPGPCVLAVRATLALMRLGDLWAVEAAAAEAMARILDDHRLATTAPSACRQLGAIMDKLHQVADVPRPRLKAIQDALLAPERA